MRDGKRGGGGGRGGARARGDVTAILEEHETTLVAVLDALPEFLNAAARALAMRLRSHAPAGSSTVAEVERVLKIRELRSAFAFNKVIAKKFHEFMRVHFDADSPAGVAVAKLGWALYVCAKCESLPTFPDLYSCYHLLVAVEAFFVNQRPARVVENVAEEYGEHDGQGRDDEASRPACQSQFGVESQEGYRARDVRRRAQGGESVVPGGYDGCVETL